MIIKNKNLLYTGISIDYQYNNSHLNNCQSRGDINNAEWQLKSCRCLKIENVQVTRININEIVDELIKQIFNNSKKSRRLNNINWIFGISFSIQKYTIDRILRNNRIWEKDSYLIVIRDGFYGQEISGVFLKDHIAENIEKQLSKALEINSLSDRIKFLLELEYGEITQHLSNKKYRIITINRGDIIFPNKFWKDSVERKDLSFYRKYNSILAIVLKTGNKWEVIDGYHRLSANKDKLDKNILVIEAY